MTKVIPLSPQKPRREMESFLFGQIRKVRLKHAFNGQGRDGALGRAV